MKILYLGSKSKILDVLQRLYKVTQTEDIVTPLGVSSL